MEENKLTPIGEVREAFLNQLERVNSLDPKDECFNEQIRYLNTLGELGVEMAKAETSSWDVEQKHILEEKKYEEEKASKESEVIEQKKDRYIRTALEALGIILPLTFYGIWMRKGFKFEETGTFTSTTFRGLFGKFKPTRR